MKEIYGLGIYRDFKEPYCYPMSLKEIDDLFYKYTKKEILNTLKQNDSVIDCNDEESFHIYKLINGKWKNYSEIITKENHYILEFSIEEFLQKEPKMLNRLYNHFSLFLNKEYIRKEFRRAICAMQESKEKFLLLWQTLNYDEQRLIRLYINQLLCEKENLKLERKVS